MDSARGGRAVQQQQLRAPNLHAPLQRQQEHTRPPQGRGSSPGGGRTPPPQGQAVHNQSGVPFGYVPGYLPGSASLVEELDKRILIVLRDGKHIVGTMISYDQFSNLILQDASERRVVVAEGVCHYADIPLGLYVARGDSTVLMGKLDSLQESRVMKEVSLEELDKIQKESGKEAAAWDFDSDLVA